MNSPPALSLSDREAILFANEAFYAAFAGKAFAAMDDLWADGDVTCIHPGWPPLRGRDAVMASWRDILGHEPPDVSAHRTDVGLRGGVAVVTCLELIPGTGRPQLLSATNLFVKQGAVWKMIHHQAGIANVDPRTLGEKEKPSVN